MPIVFVDDRRLTSAADEPVSLIALMPAEGPSVIDVVANNPSVLAVTGRSMSIVPPLSFTGVAMTRDGAPIVGADRRVTAGGLAGGAIA